MLEKIFQCSQRVFQEILEVFFPTCCCACRKMTNQAGKFLCDECYENLDFFVTDIRLPIVPCSIDQIIAAVEYKAPMSQVIQEMKYNRVKAVGKFLGEFLYNTTNFPDVDVITCTPLHERRQKFRGFNQSEEIAKELARLSGVAYRPLLEKTRSSQNQAKIHDKTKRLSNLEHAFRVVPPTSLGTTLFPHKILLIDDVTTTGTTLNACAKILKEHGAQQVFCLVVAHGN